MTVILICICAINIWIQYLIFVILYLVSPSERIMLYTSIFFLHVFAYPTPFPWYFPNCLVVHVFIPSRKAYKNLVDMHHELSFHSWLFPEYYIRGNSSVNNNIPKNNKHGQYKCNKNALVLTICQKRSTKAETVNKQNRLRSINYVLSMMSKLIFYHGKWPLHEISTMDIRLQPRVNMSRYISRELLS